MPRYLLVLPIFFITLYLDSSPALAQENFKLTYGTESITVPVETIDSWRGVVRVPKKPNFIQRTEPLKSQMARATGRKTIAARETVVYAYQPERVYKYISQLTDTISVKPQEPKLTIQNNKVTEFTPAKPGLRLYPYETTWAVIEALTNRKTNVALVATKAEPSSSLADTNNLGIRELIAQGESGFKGSPRNRRHNIKIGVQKVNGILVKPGEEFSFNKFLGPVDGEHGFLPELVIKRTGTVPEFGGGLCQVSSTTFRAAMNAGLPITQRKNHSYAVQYYAPQGTDATIYPGVIDLKFLNDTPGHILIWAYFKDDNTLVYEIYGTKDNRIVNVDTPIQYDKKTDGSMKATWRRVVVKDGVEREDVFRSVYQPPALFHRNEEFASNAPTTPTAPAATSSPATMVN